jgi:hypothetical protein
LKKSVALDRPRSPYLTVYQKYDVLFLRCGFFSVVMLVHTHTAADSTWRHVGVWRKNSTPHQNKQRKTKQTQNTTCPTTSLVAAAKQIHPHKERKDKTNPEIFDPLSKPKLLTLLETE